MILFRGKKATIWRQWIKPQIMFNELEKAMFAKALPTRDALALLSICDFI